MPNKGIDYPPLVKKISERGEVHYVELRMEKQNDDQKRFG